jgi:hypothetical protein
MRPAAKLGAFALVLAAAFGGGAAIGAAVGPIDTTDAENTPPAHDEHASVDSLPAPRARAALDHR